MECSSPNTHPIHSPETDAFTTAPSQADLLQANIDLFAHASAIPLQNRLRYLIGDEEQEAYSPYRYIDVEELAAKLNAYPEDIIAILYDLNVTADMTRTDAADHLAIAPALEVIVAEEHTWRKTYDGLKDEVTVHKMTAIFSVSREQIDNVLGSIGFEPRRVYQGENGKHISYYPKQLLFRIRAEIIMFPPARQNITATSIASDVHSRTDSVRAGITDKFVPDLMRSGQGQIFEYYDPAARTLIDQKRNSSPENIGCLRGEWDVKRELDVTIEWVRHRLENYKSGVYTNIRNGRTRVEIDETVFAALSEEIETIRKTPIISDDEVSLQQLMAPLDTTDKTALRVIRQRGFETLKRRSARSNTVFNAYDISIQLPLAQALIDDRVEQIADCELSIAKLSARPRGTLSPDEKKFLLDTYGIKAMATKRLQRARAAYEKLLNDTGTQQAETT